MSDFVLNQAIDTSGPIRKKRRYEKSTPGFRLNALQLFLTYPQCSISKELMLQKLKAIYDIDKYIISQEKHEDGNLHLHCYVKLNKVINIRNDKKFDVMEGDKTYHPNIQSCKAPKKVMSYVIKDKDYITNIEETYLKALKDNDDEVKVKTLYSLAREQASEGKLEEAFMTLSHQKLARDMTLYGPTIERNIRGLVPRNTEVEYDIDCFDIPFTWDKSKTLILHGPTNTGKTSLALALLPRALFVSHMDRLKDYNSIQYEGIVFDDMSFKHIPRDGQIHLVDTAHSRDIHVRYGMAHLPKGTPRIITTNLAPANCLLAIDPAIERRIQCVEIDKCYFKERRVAEEHSDHSNDEFDDNFNVDTILSCLTD